MRSKPQPPASPLDRALRKLGEVPDATKPTTREAKTFVAHVSTLPDMPERHARNFGLEREEFDMIVGHWQAFIEAWPRVPQPDPVSP